MAENPEELLKAGFNLDHNLRIYIPSTQDVDGDANAEQVQALIEEALEKFSQWFGGATAFDALGAWYSSDLSKVVTEKVKIVESYCTKESIEENLEKVLAFAGQIKRDLGQEAVSLEYDNRLYFI